LRLGIIDIWKADKLFFQLFENIFERAMAFDVLAWFE